MISETIVDVQNHTNYLLPPHTATAIVVLLTCACLYLAFEWRAHDTHIPGCYQLGTSMTSTIHNRSSAITTKPQIAALFVYPVKSCRGIELQSSYIKATGLEYDRLFAFAQLVPTSAGTRNSAPWRILTQRECPKLAQLETDIWIARAKDIHPLPFLARYCKSAKRDEWRSQGGCVLIRFRLPDHGLCLFERTKTVTAKLPLNPTAQRWQAKTYHYESLAIWKDCPQAVNITNELSRETQKALQKFLGLDNPLGLFRSDMTNLRTITRSLPKEEPWCHRKYRVGFADAFPIHLISLSSIRAIEKDIPCGAKIRKNLDPRRFRANIYVCGVAAFEEDCWIQIRMGGSVRGRGSEQSPATYHVACRTARCIMTNIHPESGVQDRSEPQATLKRTRQVDRGAIPHPCLGLSMMPLFPAGELRVGNTIEVEKTGEHYYEKMFS